MSALRPTWLAVFPLAIACAQAPGGPLTMDPDAPDGGFANDGDLDALGNNTTFSHTGRSRFAYDFALPRGTPLHAMADGRVIYVYNSTRPGDPCYDGGGPACIAKANQVWLRHADGSVTSYAHLNRALVARGDRVTRGTPVGRSGSSGYSTGPHAHVARQEDCGFAGCQSIRLVFQDVGGDGRPDTGDRVTSGNCR